MTSRIEFRVSDFLRNIRSYAICSLHGLDIRPKSYETDVEKVPLADALRSLRGSHLEKTVGSIGLLWDSHEIQRPALNCAKCPFHNSGRLSRGVREECDKCFECLSFHLEKVDTRMEDCCRRKTLPSGNNRKALVSFNDCREDNLYPEVSMKET